jgi:2-methylisocitrate lyase-like PEP mutase family enzyme
MPKTNPKRSQVENAEKFRQLHENKHIFVLPNAWDVPSARLFENMGFPAVATSSAGLMVSHGYPDGQIIPKKELIYTIRKISHVLKVPLSADIVAGFGTTPKEVVTTVKSVIQTGAVGVNIEDFEHSTKQLFPVEVQVKKLRTVKKLAETMKVPFVLNGRTDAYRFAQGDDEVKLEEAIKRGIAYRDAGADCVYPMGLVDVHMIRRFVKATDNYPVNVMVRKGLPSVQELDQLGVRRVSFGPAASYATFGFLKNACQEVLQKGLFSMLTEDAISFDELNSLAIPKRV